MFIIIDLKGPEEKSHKTIKFELQDQTTIKELQDEIHSKLQMEPGFQEVYDCSGRRIDLLFGSLEEAGIKCGWKLIVRHSLLNQWHGCLVHFEDMEKAAGEHVKSRIANRGLKVLNLLEGSNFFDVYNFGRQYDEMIQQFYQNACEGEPRSEVAVKRRRIDTPEIYPVGETHPEHIHRIKHLLFQALDDNEQHAIVTVIDATHAVASFHCFESYANGNKPLIIHNVFEPGKIFTLHAVKSCRASVCQVILFESEARLITEDQRVPQINLPLWGRQYYVLGLPGESRLFHEGRTHQLSYLSGSVTSVYYADEGKALRIVGDSGSRPGFSGGPLINLLYGDLIGFCVGGGPCAEDTDNVCEKFEQARFLIATPSSHVKNWEHGECENSSPNTSGSS